MARDPVRLRLYSLLDVIADGARVEDFGTLAVRLAEAQRAGVKVAESWVVPCSVFRDQVVQSLPEGHELSSLIRAVRKPDGIERPARAHQRLLDAPVRALREELETLPAPEPGGAYAVWLSTTLRDATILALTGLGGPELGSDPSVTLRRSWANVLHEHPLRVLAQSGVRDFGVGAVIQRLPKAAHTTLLLTADPERLWQRELGESRSSRASEERWLAASSRGLGLPVDAGALLADRIELSPEGKELARVTISQNVEVTLVDGSPSQTEVEPDVCCSLSDASLGLLAGAANLGGRAEPKLLWFHVSTSDEVSLCSIERAIGAGYPDGGEPSTVWSRSGLDALLPRVATPLTAGLVERASAESLKHALRELGGRAPKSSLVQSVQGRAYFNLSALFEVVGSVPGLDPTALLDLVRGASNEQVQAALELRARSPSLAALSLAALRLKSQEREMRAAVEDFGRRAQAQSSWLSEMDLAILPDDALKTTLAESYEFFRDTARLLLGSSLAFLSAFVATRAVVSRSRPADASRLTHRITAGAGDLETVAPTVALADVIAAASQDNAALLALRGGVSTLGELPTGSLRRALVDWQVQFGDRGLGEPEIAEPRFGEDSSALLAFVRAGVDAPGSVAQRLSRVRVDADEARAGLEANLGYLDGSLLRALLLRLHGLLRLREQMRVWLAKTVHMLRIVVLDVDRRLRRLDRSLSRGAAFYLAPRELSSAIGSVRADLGAVVKWRRAGFEHLSALADPPEIFVGRPPRLIAFGPSSTLRGEAAGGGVAEGTVRHIAELHRLTSSDVLVVRSLDVGLAPILPSIAGVIAECGGTLAHGAVAARELGVPAVVGLPNARALLASGTRVRLDGESGIVERV